MRSLIEMRLLVRSPKTFSLPNQNQINQKESLIINITSKKEDSIRHVNIFILNIIGFEP